MSGLYDFWRSALKQPHLIGKVGGIPMHEGEPECGYYRMRVKGGTDLPAAIWMAGEEMVAKVGDQMRDPLKIWTWCGRDPIPYEQYTAVMGGGEWPDAPPKVEPKPREEPAGIGHNHPEDPVEAIKAELAGEIELAQEFLKKPITSQEDADKAATWAKRLSELESRADKTRETLKRPHLEAGKKVDAEWQPIVRGAGEWKSKLKTHLTPWLIEQDRLERERQAEARREADRVKAEAAAAAAALDEASRAIEEADISAPLDPDIIAEQEAAEAEATRLAEAAAAAERDAAQRKTAAGRTGGKVSLRTTVIAEITDYDKLLMALKDRTEVRELVQSLANRAAKAGVALEGMKISEKKEAA